MPSSFNLSFTFTSPPQGIISDLFPGVVLPKPDYQKMETAMCEACAKSNLQPTEYFLLKSIQVRLTVPLSALSHTH